MSGKIVTFWLPHLLSATRVQEMAEIINQLPLPSLKRLLSKADVFVSTSADFAEQACYLAHSAHMHPVAPLTAQVDLKDFDANLFWLRVDPVQLVPDRDQLVLIPNDHLQVQVAEAMALIEAFNQHFAQDGVALQYGAPDRWYMSIAQAVDIQSTSLEKAAWQSVQNYMPQGNAKTYWRQLINETQMLFYTHPVNEARRQSGLPEINSVWVWGEGFLPAENLSSDQWTFFTNHVYLQGLAKWMRADVQKVPQNAQAWADLKPKKRSFIFADCLDASLAQCEADDYQQALIELERNWFAPFEQMLKQREISSLLLDLGQGKRFHVTPKHLKKFWRRSKPLTHWL